MLMSPYRPQANRVTDAGNQLLDAIRQAGEAGITRSELAKVMGKKRLNMWHEAQLKVLEDTGAVVVTTRPNARLAHITEYVYRVKV